MTKASPCDECNAARFRHASQLSCITRRTCRRCARWCATETSVSTAIQFQSPDCNFSKPCCWSLCFCDAAWLHITNGLLFGFNAACSYNFCKLGFMCLFNTSRSLNKKFTSILASYYHCLTCKQLCNWNLFVSCIKKSVMRATERCY